MESTVPSDDVFPSNINSILKPNLKNDDMRTKTLSDLHGESVNILKFNAFKNSGVKYNRLKDVDLGTIKQMAEYKPFRWARAIQMLKQHEILPPIPAQNLGIDQIVNKKNLSLDQLLDEPLTTLNDFSEAHVGDFEAMNVKTIADLASWDIINAAAAIYEIGSYIPKPVIQD